MKERVILIDNSQHYIINRIISILQQENINYTINDDGIRFNNCLVKIFKKENLPSNFSYDLIDTKRSNCNYLKTEYLPDEELLNIPEVPRINKQLIKQNNRRTNDILRRYRRR